MCKESISDSKVQFPLPKSNLQYACVCICVCVCVCMCVCVFIYCKRILCDCYNSMILFDYDIHISLYLNTIIVLVFF